MSNSSASSGGGNSSVSPSSSSSSSSPEHLFTVDEIAEMKTTPTTKKFTLAAGTIQLGQYYTISLKPTSFFKSPETFNGFFVLYNGNVIKFYNTSGPKFVQVENIKNITPAELPTDIDIIKIYSDCFSSRYEELRILKSMKRLSKDKLVNLKDLEITPNQIKNLPSIMKLSDDIKKEVKNKLTQSQIEDDLYTPYFFPTTEDLTNKIQFPGSPNYQSGTEWTIGGRRRRSRSRATRQKKNRRRSTRSKRRSHIRK